MSTNVTTPFFSGGTSGTPLNQTTPVNILVNVSNGGAPVNPSNVGIKVERQAGGARPQLFDLPNSDPAATDFYITVTIPSNSPFFNHQCKLTPYAVVSGTTYTGPVAEYVYFI